MKVKLDDIAKIFLGDDHERRKWATQLNEQNGFVYATDTHCLLKAPKEYFRDKYVAHEKCANFDKLYESYILSDQPVFISIKNARALLNKVEKVNQTVDCDFCDGEGSQECDLGHFHDCEECGGKGRTENPHIKVLPDEGNLIKVEDSFFTPYSFDKMVSFFEYIGVEKVDLVKYGFVTSNIFRYNNVDVVVMSCYPERHGYENMQELPTKKLKQNQ